VNHSFHIDITFDFRSDSPMRNVRGKPKRKDPDTWSPTLARYHKLLWSKPLPDGTVFELETTAKPRFYHYHKSKLGKFCLSSDTAYTSFSNHRSKAVQSILQQIPDEVESFIRQGYTIGGMMIFPAIKIDGQPTINGARGFHPWIKDRFDLTMECIRRHYHGGESPLTEVLMRYEKFFALFQSFRGYVDFFLLQDLVTDDYSTVKFFTPFEEFEVTPAIPQTVDDYLEYRKAAMAFITARGQRMKAWAEENLAS
jgi:hypothetical protein